MRREDNEMLCRVGPGTPMGKVFRAYWNPIADAKQLTEPDGDPVRIRFCGEDFVAFRDTGGKLGLLDEFCSHRGASLALGRNEAGGLRCIYHGWKYDVSGALLEAPNNPDPDFCSGFRAAAYPGREAGGLIWGYFGAADKEPAFPHFAFFDPPEDNLYVVRVDLNCNYTQLLEGGLDSSHVGILHADMANPGWASGNFQRNTDANNPGGLAVADDAPMLSIETTNFGFHYAAIRKGENGNQSVRIVPFIMPSARIIPAEVRTATLFEVPRDDENTSTYLVAFGEFTGDRPRQLKQSGLDDPRLWSEDDFRWRGTWENRFGQDRSRMKESWSGFKGLEPEDAAVALSMGPIYDRTREHLVPADAAVVHLRRLLLEAAQAMEAGEDAPPLPDLTKVCAVVDTEIAACADWRALAPDNIAIADKAAE